MNESLDNPDWKPDWEQYHADKKDAWDAIKTSTDSFDRSMLTVSSGLLGLSVAFIKDIVTLKQANWLCVLYASWVALGTCILLTVVSFRLSADAHIRNLKYIYLFYIEGKQEYLNKRSWSAKALDWFNHFTGMFFVLGTAMTLIFAIHNVQKEHQMSNKNVIPAVKVREGLQTLPMTNVKGSSDLEKGLNTVPMTPPAQQPPAPTQPKSNEPGTLEKKVMNK